MVNIKKFSFCDTEILEEVAKREKESGIRPDVDVDTYMKATAMPGNKAMLAVEHIIRVSMHCDNLSHHFMKSAVFLLYISAIGNAG